MASEYFTVFVWTCRGAYRATKFVRFFHEVLGFPMATYSFILGNYTELMASNETLPEIITVLLFIKPAYMDM